MQPRVYLDTNGFWTWTLSENKRVIILSLGHKSKAAARRHLKDYAPTQEAKMNKFPWKHTSSPYVTAGPKERKVFVIYGTTFIVTPTDAKGRDTGRTRFKVDCVDCDCVLHEQTTGPAFHVLGHMRENHNLKREVEIEYEG